MQPDQQTNRSRIKWIDDHILRIGRRFASFLTEYGLFIVVLLVGLVVWYEVFSRALVDYLDSSLWHSRGVWLGNGSIELFGYTVSYQLEGYTDYSFYYVHWGHNMLRGVMPYCDEFGHLEMNGYVNENGLYIFPPLTAVLYGIGIALVPENWGIGLLFTIFGFLTVFPVYGIARELSNNKRVGEVAALTYLLNPNTLYHIVFLWTNPAPFIFFFFSGFYLLIKQKKYAGTLFIVTAALFKQTAWFLGLPLVVYLIIRPTKEKTEDTQDEERGQEDAEKPPIDEKDTEKQKSSLVDDISKTANLVEFLKTTIIVIIYAAAILYPFVLAQPAIFTHLSLAAGGFPLSDPPELPGYGTPITLQVLPLVAGYPEIALMLNTIVYFGFLLWFGVILTFGLMLLQKREEGKERQYMRRLLFMALIMMLWVNIAGPRGVFKYYFTLFAPFFSIFSSSQMVTSKEDKVPFSVSMLFLPIVMSLMILVPDRTVYLFGVILIFIGYLLASQIGTFWHIVKTPGRIVVQKLSPYYEKVRVWSAGIIAKIQNYSNETES